MNQSHRHQLFSNISPTLQYFSKMFQAASSICVSSHYDKLPIGSAQRHTLRTQIALIMLFGVNEAHRNTTEQQYQLQAFSGLCLDISRSVLRRDESACSQLDMTGWPKCCRCSLCVINYDPPGPRLPHLLLVYTSASSTHSCCPTSRVEGLPSHAHTRGSALVSLWSQVRYPGGPFCP